MNDTEPRPEPEALLAEAAKEGRGRLKIFLGAAPGVGKTYAMLEAARRRAADGIDVGGRGRRAHGRAETEALVRGLEVMPRRAHLYRGRILHEMDLDALLARRPQLALIDELAHSNVGEIVGRRPDSVAVAASIEELAGTFGNRLVTSRVVREQHGNTTTWIASEPPDAVVFPQSTEDVRQTVRICARRGVPVIPFGAGTSFEGSVNAPLGGVSVDFRDMNRVLAVHAEDFDCVVEPGITRSRLNQHLRDQGLFFPVDPGSDASLGGMASTRGSGTTAVRYGTMKDNVLALKVVLPSGELMSTSRRARKSSAGYDLTRLVVGAEGTLGIITELTLKLYGIPEAVAAGVCPFPSIEAACATAIAAIQAGIPVARVEFMEKGRFAPAMPMLGWASRRCRRSSSSFTAPRPALRSNRSASARSRESSARFLRVGDGIPGAEPPLARAPPCVLGRQVVPARGACHPDGRRVPSRGLRNASPRRNATSSGAGSSRPS